MFRRGGFDPKGKPDRLSSNPLDRQFRVDQPDTVWVTDIMLEGWLCLAVVLDLHSHAVIGWFMKTALSRDLVLDALLPAVWQRRLATVLQRVQPGVGHEETGGESEASNGYLT